MSAKGRRRFSMAVRREAIRAARAWDLSPKTIDAIRRAAVMSCGDCTSVAIFYYDGIVQAQAPAAFIHAVVQLAGHFRFSSFREIIPEKWETGVASIVVLCFSDLPVEGAKARKEGAK